MFSFLFGAHDKLRVCFTLSVCVCLFFFIHSFFFILIYWKSFQVIAQQPQQQHKPRKIIAESSINRKTIILVLSITNVNVDFWFSNWNQTKKIIRPFKSIDRLSLVYTSIRCNPMSNDLNPTILLDISNG